MAAYLIVDLDVEDLSALAEYRRQAAPLVVKYGGRALIRLGVGEVLDGDWRPKRMMCLEFATMTALKRWWTSEEYEPLKPLRQRVSKANVIAVEGV
jgi:uncharacterized protein (DUF1330 family)